MSTTLGVATVAYLPFCCFFNLLTWRLSSLAAILGLRIQCIEPEDELREMPERADFHGAGGRWVEPTEHEAAVRPDG